ncbi:MAG: hypothetical protein Fur0012_09120 [Elusimicrobiota bacterium]
MKIIVLLFLLLQSVASAQQFSAGAIFEPSSFLSQDKEPAVSTYSFSSAFLEYFKDWKIDFSTSSSSVSEQNLEKTGLGRSELVNLAFIAEKSGSNFYKLMERAIKDGSIEKIASENSFSLKSNFRKAVAVKEEIEKKAGDEIKRLTEILLSTAAVKDSYE